MTIHNQGQTDFGGQKNARAMDQVGVCHSILDKLKPR